MSSRSRFGDDFLRAATEALRADISHPPQDTIPVPESLIIEFLERLSVLENVAKSENEHAPDTGQPSLRFAHFDFWNWLAKVIPYTKEYECTLLMRPITRPAVGITKKLPKIPEGAIPVSGENWSKLRKAMETDDHEKTPLTRYRVWKLVEDLFPQTATDGNWSFRMDTRGVFLIPAKEEDED